MRGLFVLCVVCMQLGWSYAYPGNAKGVGAYAYQDSAGNRYGGTYDLKDGDEAFAFTPPAEVFTPPAEVFNGKDDFAPFAPYSPHDIDDFLPEYFRNFENLLQDAFANQIQNQRIALDAARKAFDLTSNQAGYIPNFADRFNPFGGMPNFGGFGGFPQMNFPQMNFPQMNFPPMTPNSAFAGAAAGPGFNRQMIAINPQNPNMPNVDVTERFAESESNPTRRGFYSVQSSSYSSSSNVGGKVMNNRGGQTVVNDNGKVSSYKVNN